MLASAIILFRESLEAALIISIILTATRGLRHRGLWVNIGLLAGIAAALLVALFAGEISALAEGTGQELFNAGVLLAACLMLGWHNVWMSGHGREFSDQAKQAGTAVGAGERHMSTLAIVVGLAVLREGSEVVLFITGILAGGTDKASVLTGAGIGLAGGVLLGAVLYQGLMRVPLRHFFSMTSWLILLLAAGLASQAAGYLVQAGYLAPLGEPVWDSSAFLTEGSIAGRVLHSLVGYIARPSGTQVVFWASAFLLIWGLGLLARKTIERKPITIPASLMVIFGTGLLYSGHVSASHVIYSPIVDYGETEVEFRGHYDFDSDASRDGAAKYKLDLGRGVKPRWFTEIVMEYEDPAQGSGQVTAVEWENIIQLTEQGRYAADWGLLLEYSHSREDGHADKLEFGPLMQMEFGRQLWTNNLILEKEIGSRASDKVEWEFASRLQRRVNPLFEPALELYAEEHELQIGPAVLGKTRVGQGRAGFAWQAAVLGGLTNDTPDVTVRFLIEAEFY